jgi:hypothetical protein
MIAKFVKEITVKDPDTGNAVELSVFKYENGGMFAIDSSFYLQVSEENENGNCYINDPLNDDGEVELIE